VNEYCIFPSVECWILNIFSVKTCGFLWLVPSQQLFPYLYGYMVEFDCDIVSITYTQYIIAIIREKLSCDARLKVK
jgi:hypothetical protein